MDYFKSLFERFFSAIGTWKFWAQASLVFGLSGLGIWWPLFFEWKGYDNFFYPVSWFTYGVATLMIIVGQRLFMKESDDNQIMPNRLVLLICSIFGAVLYGKSVGKFLNFDFSSNVEFDYSLTHYACLLTVIAWVIHETGKNEYDKVNNKSVLGGDV